MRDLGQYLQQLVGPSSVAPVQDTLRIFVSKVKEETKKKQEAPSQLTQRPILGTNPKADPKRLQKKKKKTKKVTRTRGSHPEQDFSPPHDSPNSDNPSDDDRRKRQDSPKKETRRHPRDHPERSDKSSR